MKMVITFRSGVQLSIGVESYETRSDPVSGALARIDYTLDDDPNGNSLAWVSVPDVVAVHSERGQEGTT